MKTVPSIIYTAYIQQNVKYVTYYTKLSVGILPLDYGEVLLVCVWVCVGAEGGGAVGAYQEHAHTCTLHIFIAGKVSPCSLQIACVCILVCGFLAT